MADFEPLFVPATELQAPPGTADAIRRRARTIRRRRRTTLSAGSVAAATLVVLQLGHVEGTSSLRPARDPVATTLATAPVVRGTPRGAVTLAPLRPTPGLPSSIEVRPTPHAQVPRAIRPTVNGHTPYGHFEVGVRPGLSSQQQVQAFACDRSAGWDAGPAGWCLAFTDTTNDPSAPRTNRADHWWVGVWACRTPGSGDGYADLTTPPRLRISTPQAGTQVFDSATRWRGQSPQLQGTNTKRQLVKDASCMSFAVGWDTRDDAGVLVPEGLYRYDFDFADPAFAAWSDGHSGPSLRVTYGDVH